MFPISKVPSPLPPLIFSALMKELGDILPIVVDDLLHLHHGLSEREQFVVPRDMSLTSWKSRESDGSEINNQHCSYDSD